MLGQRVDRDDRHGLRRRQLLLFRAVPGLPARALRLRASTGTSTGLQPHPGCCREVCLTTRAPIVTIRCPSPHHPATAHELPPLASQKTPKHRGAHNVLGFGHMSVSCRVGWRQPRTPGGAGRGTWVGGIVSMPWSRAPGASGDGVLWSASRHPPRHDAPAAPMPPGRCVE